ncbi:hypothetical protein GCM10011322_40010 [Salinarimonas ramus]|uniref:Peptidoglycan binding-like domain-containing protein n=1 Tax=Salinarimonas ramus TaxID=690164 RepID=A0A917V7I3_9HYPH|nr:hypothetical protein GCM10011322_40010 [Salinarimonas ramus]
MLRDLGYDPGPIDGIVTDDTKRAIADFQRERGMAVSGLIDANTHAGIVEIHSDMLYYGSDDETPPR